MRPPVRGAGVLLHAYRDFATLVTNVSVDDPLSLLPASSLQF
jgi:hypothetical protein